MYVINKRTPKKQKNYRKKWQDSGRIVEIIVVEKYLMPSITLLNWAIELNHPEIQIT